MTGTPNKRQKREDYRKQQEIAKQEAGVRLELPKKKFYRQRAHANPFSDHALIYPACPAEMEWESHYPAFCSKADQSPASQPKFESQVEIADIGCGFGGLLVALSPLYPETLMLGMELRTQVTDYVANRVEALRSQGKLSNKNGTDTTNGGGDDNDNDVSKPYQNISVLRSNTMKFLPNYFNHNQLTKVFLCFPDPHFKQRKHKARIVSAQLNAEYAYVVRPGGKVYTITDVEELHQWMVKHFVGEEAGDAAELWRRVDEEELVDDPCVKVMSEETEESKKVTRNGGKKFVAVFARRENPEWPD